MNPSIHKHLAHTKQNTCHCQEKIRYSQNNFIWWPSGRGRMGAVKHLDLSILWTLYHKIILRAN